MGSLPVPAFFYVIIAPAKGGAMDRREFLEASGVLAGGAVLGGIPSRQALKPPPMIGIQVGAVSFVDEGTDRVLDSLRELASVNTLFVATFTYGRGIAGRQLPNQPLPDHGKQEYDTATFRGGNYATPHPQYYTNTSITPETRAGSSRLRRARRRASARASARHEGDLPGSRT